MSRIRGGYRSKSPGGVARFTLAKEAQLTLQSSRALSAEGENERLLVSSFRLIINVKIGSRAVIRRHLALPPAVGAAAAAAAAAAINHGRAALSQPINVPLLRRRTMAATKDDIDTLISHWGLIVAYVRMQ